jgi:chain length determinant protein EpsF
MDVQPSRESNVITVTYKSPDPKFAAALANAFVQAFIDTSLELRVDPAKQFSTFFDNRAKEARESLEQAQSRATAFQRERGIMATDERLDIETSRLNELSSQLVAMQAVAGESVSRQAAAAGGSLDRIPEVLGSPVVSGLTADISRLEARLQELNSRLGDNNPQVIELKANLRELRVRMQEEMRRVAGGVSVTSSINRQREGQIRAELESQRAKVLRLKQVRDEASVLTRDVESAQRNYEAVLSRLNQTNLESQATQSNVKLLTVATPPLQHATPRVGFNTLIASMVGTMLAVGLALLLEMLDRRVRTLDDVSAALGLPVIGVLPRPGAGKGLLGRGRTSAMQRRVLGQLPAPSKGF